MTSYIPAQCSFGLKLPAYLIKLHSPCHCTPVHSTEEAQSTEETADGGRLPEASPVINQLRAPCHCLVCLVPASMSVWTVNRECMRGLLCEHQLGEDEKHMVCRA